MFRKTLTIAALLALSIGSAGAQNTTNPSIMAGSGAYNSSPPTCTAGQFCLLQTDSHGILKVVPSGTPSGTQDVNVFQWGGVAVGAMANYGTSPGAVLVPGVNSFMTNPLPTGTNNAANVGGVTKVVCVTPTVTNATYGANVVMGGLLTFTNLFSGTAHSGVIQSIVLNFTTAQTVGFLFFPFASNPSNSTWTDHSAAAINSADVFAVRSPTALSTANSNLGTQTNYGAVGIGQAFVSADANLYGILVPTATTAALGGTASVVQICVKVLADL